MGVIDTVARGLFLQGGLQALGGVRDAFRPNATRQLELGHEAFVAVQTTLATEFQSAGGGAFDRFVNALNRLPRPILALGTMGLFLYAMLDPAGFATRMRALAMIPEPLWWLLGAVVAFYFGARETHYMRGAQARRPATGLPVPTPPEAPNVAPVSAPAPTAANPALQDWLARGQREAGDF